MAEDTAVTTPPAAEEQVETTTTTEVDAEARIAQLEKEKADLIVESSNYKLGMLKAKSKAKEEI